MADAEEEELPALQVRGLRKRFGEVAAVDGLDFSVPRGEIFGLLGPNGSGKTTTLNLLTGLAEPTEGTVRVFGLDPRKQAASARRLIGVVPQETALYEELTAERNLMFHAELFGIPPEQREERVLAMLALVRLSPRPGARVGTYSGGMKRRLAIARALMHDPRLVFLDEPTLGVDVQARRAIWDYVLEMKTHGRTVLLTTNYLEEANALCDRLAILDHGRLVAMDRPADLKARYGASVVLAEVDRDVPESLAERLRGMEGVRDVTVDGPRVTWRLGGEVHSISPMLQAISAAGCSLRRLNMREPALEEVFLALTGWGLRD